MSGVTYDYTVHNVRVIVTDNNEGQLIAEADYGKEAEEVIFTNMYTTSPVKVRINGRKIRWTNYNGCISKCSIR